MGDSRTLKVVSHVLALSRLSRHTTRLDKSEWLTDSEVPLPVFWVWECRRRPNFRTARKWKL